MDIVLKPKSTSEVPKLTSRILPRLYPVIKNGKPAQLELHYKLYFRDGVLYALENSHRCGIARNTDCWDYFNNNYRTLDKVDKYEANLQAKSAGIHS